jgi:hypothetical protein
VVTLELLRDFAHHLYTGRQSGAQLSPQLFSVAIQRLRNYIPGTNVHDLATVREPNFVLGEGEVTVRDLFNVHLDDDEEEGPRRSKRASGFYSSNIPAAILNSAKNVKDYTGEAACGRCSNPNAGKVFDRCRQTAFGRQLMAHGACTNCQFDGASSSCTFYRECLKVSTSIVYR